MPTVISELIAFYLVDEVTLGLWDNPDKQSKTLASIGGGEGVKSRKRKRSTLKKKKALTSKRQISERLVDEEMSLMPSLVQRPGEGAENLQGSENDEE